MKLSELKQKNALAWQLLKDECIKQYSEQKFEELCDKDAEIDEICEWSCTDQGHKVWADIHFRNDFKLFEKWVREHYSKGKTSQTPAGARE